MRHLLLAAVAAAALAPASGHAATLIGLTADNRLVSIDTDTRRASAPVAIRGVEGRVLGIDQRPANGTLVALTDTAMLYTIDPRTGAATPLSRLTERADLGGRAVVDVNPTVDRLRVIGVNGMNLRINMDTGATLVDGAIKYADGDRNAGTMPRVTAGAYTNSVKGATQTALYTIDTLLGSFNLQAPPNDGMQQSKASLGMSLPPATAFDILADGDGGNRGFVLANGTLHRLDVQTGALSVVGPVANLPGEIIDIAAMR
ncbi:DUF4394 domain-containing protein [Elioraea tepidiphila]|jgi:hypothetical protein|uniref:DUF4394 domain-containing protein n=1 Tax=Elioraea tepidiphila TaxID=457934 RepID=UPI00035FF8B1|nr:DUF4394 domain-containing protein [Elioraea tepidiphila]